MTKCIDKLNNHLSRGSVSFEDFSVLANGTFEDFSVLANRMNDSTIKFQESLLMHRDGPQLNKTSESTP